VQGLDLTNGFDYKNSTRTSPLIATPLEATCNLPTTGDPEDQRRCASSGRRWWNVNTVGVDSLRRAGAATEAQSDEGAAAMRPPGGPTRRDFYADKGAT
jgi:hypothetical protein